MLVVNPFSAEAMRMVGELDSGASMPDRISRAFQLAREMMEEEKKGSGRDKTTARSKEVDAKDDVLSIHLLLRSVASKYGYPSGESRVVVELLKRLVRDRLWTGLNSAYQQSAKVYREDVVLTMFSDLLAPVPVGSIKDLSAYDLAFYSASREDKNIPRYVIPKERVLPLLRGADKKMTDLYIFNGYVAASLNEMVDYYCEAVGSKAIEMLSRTSQSDDPRLGELAALVAQVPRKLQKTYSPLISGRRVSGGRPLAMEHFPPCIKHTLEGVSSGSRNYAITVLLTSFLSYARIAPVGSGKDSKISDHLKDIAVVYDEVLPVIDEAGRRCVPPLFEDQPAERMNVIYHLGFGLTKEPTLDDAGKSSWYFPPNCDKVQREAPSLCTPDDHCRTIKNPLSYYAKKLFPKKENVEKEPKEEKAQLIDGEKLEGKIVEIQDGSGLIQRCPKCDRWIIDNFCIVHSDVEGIWDLRIKAKFAYDQRSCNLVFKRKSAEMATRISLEEARKIGPSATLEKIKEALNGKNFEVIGKRLTKNFIVKGIREI